MAKFCVNCGATATPVEENAVTEEPVADAADATVEPAPSTIKIANITLDKKFLPLLAIGGIVVLAILALLISLIFGGGGYKSVVDNMIDVTYYGNAGAIEDLAPEEYWIWYEEEYDDSVDDIMEDYEDDVDDLLDELEDRYGKRILVSYDITDTKDLSDRKVEKIADSLEDRYDIDPDDISAAMELEVEIQVEGSEDDDDTDSTITVVKINGDWYPISYYMSGDGYRVSFLVSNII